MAEIQICMVTSPLTRPFLFPYLKVLQIDSRCGDHPVGGAWMEGKDQRGQVDLKVLYKKNRGEHEGSPIPTHKKVNISKTNPTHQIRYPKFVTLNSYWREEGF